MPLNTAQAKKLAATRKRDAHGHFIKNIDLAKAKVTISTPPAGTIPDFEKPLVQVSLNNPFKKILYWLNQIRKRQTTTLAFKLSIPLIALPVIIAGVFTLGRATGISFQKTQTPPVVVPSPKPDPIISRAGTLKIALSQQTKYLLALKNGELVVLLLPQTINLNQYNGKQVLVTGTYNSTANVLRVTDIAEVQVFNTTVIPSPTPSADSTSSAQ